jgi:hypothetical protein
MRARRLGPWSLVLLLALAAALPAQELWLSAGAGGFFPSGEACREVYGSGWTCGGDLWFKLKGPIGFAAGFSRLSDRGAAVPIFGGGQTYPLEFGRTSIPLIVFYELKAGPAAIRLGAGAGIDSYRETWSDLDLEFKGRKVSPRFALGVFVRVVDRLAVFGSAGAGSIRTGEGSFLDSDVNLGGFQVCGGIAVRIF